MKAGWCAVMLILLAVSAVSAQQPELYSPQELNDLVAPIALFPDPLLAQMLPAATFSDQVQEAAAVVSAQGESAIDAQNWDPSVKAVARFPEALDMLAQNPEWTQALGFAVVYQNQQVLEAVQEMRRQAQAAGNLTSTPQQQVTTEDQIIVIAPAQPNVIFVPRYDPQVVFVNQGPTWGDAVVSPLISFGIGYAMGSLWPSPFRWHSWGWYRPPVFHPISPFRPPFPPYRPSVRPPTRPPGARPEARPPSARPPTTPGARPSLPSVRPEVPGGRPTVPSTRPSVPSTRPAVPSTRPSVPGTRPALPSTRPSVPGTRPAVPGARPSVPGTRPAVPGARPSVPSTRPTGPSARPSVPTTRPAPATRPDWGRPSPSPRPSGSGFGGYTSRPQVQQQRARGQQSMGQAQARPSASRASAPRASAPRGGGGGGGGRRR